MPDDIRVQSVTCLEQGDHLDAHLANVDCTPTQTRLRDELGRYRVWCSSTKACKTGTMSLEHRVRHSERSRSCIVQFLDELEVNITEANAIVKGERVPLDELEFSDSDASEISLPNAKDESTELEQIVDDIAEIVTSLFDLTRSLSSANAMELMINASNVNMQHFKFSDRLGVQLQFPRASREIVERLVLANNKRRQIFKYLEEHRTATPENVYVDSYPSTTQPEVPQSTAKVLSSDSIDESGEVTADEHFKLPVVPNQVLEGVPFTCPYCHAVLHVSNVKSWRLHVMEDLKPYVCTYERCEYPLNLFNDEHQWIQHEKLHRKIWTCPHCCDHSWSTASLRDHLSSEHDDMADDTTIDLCESSALLYDTIECPLCTITTSDFSKHVAHHLWAVALHTLPLPKDSALSSVGDEGIAKSEAEELEVQTSDVAMLEPEQGLTEVEEMEVEQSRSTHPNQTTLELDHRLAEVREADAEQQDLPEVTLALRQAFVMAATRGDLTTVKELYEQSSNMYYFSDVLSQALTEASERGDADVVSFLLRLNNVDTNCWTDDVSMRTPLACAAANGHSAVVQVLLADPTVEIEARDDEQATPLSLAAGNGHLAAVQILVERGAYIETRDDHGNTPLCRAVQADVHDVVQALIRAGADTNVGNILVHGFPLWTAAARGHEAIVKSLLSAGASASLAIQRNGTPLHKSVMRGSEQIVISLLDAGADINQVDLLGMTPLHHSVVRGHVRIAQTLLAYGADVNAIDGDGLTPLWYAAVEGHTNIVRLMLQAPHLNFRAHRSDDESISSRVRAMGLNEIHDILAEAGFGTAAGALYGEAAEPPTSRHGNADIMLDTFAEPYTKAKGSTKIRQNEESDNGYESEW